MCGIFDYHFLMLNYKEEAEDLVSADPNFNFQTYEGTFHCSILTTSYNYCFWAKKLNLPGTFTVDSGIVITECPKTQPQSAPPTAEATLEASASTGRRVPSWL